MPKPLLADALDAAITWHGVQLRKDGSPYVSHLLQVAGLVLEHGGSEVAAAAALLHDVVEDTDVTLAEIRARFGEAVADIVDDCTDTIEGIGRGPDTWRRRKEAYLEGLAVHQAPSVLVSACDKLHNLRCMARNGSDGFNASPEAQRWFYDEVVRVLSARDDIPAAIVDELRSLTDRAWR